jgi:hypothetical protein
MIVDFPHTAPNGYSYSFEDFKSGIVRIWLHSHQQFDYNLGARTKSVWGFWKPKSNKYYSPVNSKTVGKEVDIRSTRNYSAMPIKLTPLESAFFQ